MAVSRVPVAPDVGVWDAAVGDHRQGRVLPQEFRLGAQQARVGLTGVFRQQWAQLGLTPEDRQAVVQAIIMLGNQQQHPLLGISPLPLSPAGGHMMCPLPGVTVTWLPHWRHPEQPILCTITVV